VRILIFSTQLHYSVNYRGFVDAKLASRVLHVMRSWSRYVPEVLLR
jgi:hypothetical protein